MTERSKTAADPVAIWCGNARLYWRDDSFGNTAMALYVGGLCIGYVMPISKNPLRAERPWRVWLMTNEEGGSLGWHKTEQEAKDALVDAAVKELQV
jgi:hypothetical protein